MKVGVKMEDKIKVVIYLRTATKDKKELKAQEQIVRKYCEKNNYDIVEKFVDFGVSSNKEFKPELEEMLNYMQSVPFFLIITKDLSRLSRNAIQVYDYIKYCDEICRCDIETVDLGQSYKFEIKIFNSKLNKAINLNKSI